MCFLDDEYDGDFEGVLEADGAGKLVSCCEPGDSSSAVRPGGYVIAFIGRSSVLGDAGLFRDLPGIGVEVRGLAAFISTGLDMMVGVT